MFSSTQALARRALFGQFGMAATQHDHNTNSRKLNNVNLVRTCDDLKPSAPLALKISGTLRGVVNVYDRKLKFPSDVVPPLLVKKVEMNEAWRIKSVPVSAVLPKNLAMFGKVTLIKKQFSTSNHNYQAGYFIMQLDNSEDPFNDKKDVKDLEHPKHHQADRVDSFGTNQTEEHLVSRFKRFDVEGENKDKNANFDSHDHGQIPTTLVPSLPQENSQSGPVEDNDIAILNNQQTNECKEVQKRPDPQDDEYKWERPDPGCMKMNTDASIRRVQDKTKVKDKTTQPKDKNTQPKDKIFNAKGAVVFRDSDAKFIYGCCIKFEGLKLINFDSDYVEMLTVHRGLEKAIGLGFKWIWAETDNLNVVKEINEDKTPTLNTEKVVEEIWNLIRKHSIKFKITHIKKDGNGAAHFLVSRSFDKDFDFVDPSKISQAFVKKLKNDERGVPRRNH